MAKKCIKLSKEQIDTLSSVLYEKVLNRRREIIPIKLEQFKKTKKYKELCELNKKINGLYLEGEKYRKIFSEKLGKNEYFFDIKNLDINTPGIYTILNVEPINKMKIREEIILLTINNDNFDIDKLFDKIIKEYI